MSEKKKRAPLLDKLDPGTITGSNSGQTGKGKTPEQQIFKYVEDFVGGWLEFMMDIFEFHPKKKRKKKSSGGLF